MQNSRERGSCASAPGPGPGYHLCTGDTFLSSPLARWNCSELLVAGSHTHTGARTQGQAISFIQKYLITWYTTITLRGLYLCAWYPGYKVFFTMLGLALVPSYICITVIVRVNEHLARSPSEVERTVIAIAIWNIHPSDILYSQVDTEKAKILVHTICSFTFRPAPSEVTSHCNTLRLLTRIVLDCKWLRYHMEPDFGLERAMSVPSRSC